MSHPRLNNPRVRLAKSAEATRVKRAPRHAFKADRAVIALWRELGGATRLPMYRAGCPEVAVISVRRGVNVWCRKGQFFWRDITGTMVTHPANDPAGAAARLRVLPWTGASADWRHLSIAAA